MLLNRVVWECTMERTHNWGWFFFMNSNYGIQYSKPQKASKVYLGREWRIKAPLAVDLSNFVPVIKNCKMSPFDTAQHHVRKSYSGTPWKQVLGKCSCRCRRVRLVTVNRRHRAIGNWKSWTHGGHMSWQRPTRFTVWRRAVLWMKGIGGKVSCIGVTSYEKWICYDNLKRSAQLINPDGSTSRTVS